jgi:hypothetical protein
MAIQLSDKDFSDSPESILSDHLVKTAELGLQKLVNSDELFRRYVLSPRIALENLSPWRSFLSVSFGVEMGQSVRNDVSVLINWIRENIKIDSIANKHSRAPLTPVGVYNLRVADPSSRDIFFVAACRTFGIPARLNPETQIPEYSKNGEWFRAGFDPQATIQPEKGTLKLIDNNNPVTPQYALHYTIAILRDGFYRTLEFPEGKVLTSSAQPLILETGHYALITGNRIQDGSVLSGMTFFTIDKGKLTTISVELRKQPGNLKPSGKLDPEQLKLEKTGDNKVVSLASLTAGKQMILVILDPEKEPSKHILNDLGPYVDHFNKWGGQFIFAIPAEKAAQAGVLKTYQLPGKMESGTDLNGNILKAVSVLYGDGLIDKLPLVLLCDEAGNVYLFSSGYKIGMGEQLLKVISSLESIRKMSVVKASCSK